MSKPLTFRQLEAGENWCEQGIRRSALEEWYCHIRDTPIEEVEIGDLCRACRQRLHLTYVVPIAVKHLRMDPLAGEMFDGELLAAMRSIPTSFWRVNCELSQKLASVLESVKEVTEDKEILADAVEVCKRLRAES